MDSIIQGKDYAFTSMLNGTIKITCTCSMFCNRVHYTEWKNKKINCICNIFCNRVDYAKHLLQEVLKFYDPQH